MLPIVIHINNERTTTIYRLPFVSNDALWDKNRKSCSRPFLFSFSCLCDILEIWSSMKTLKYPVLSLNYPLRPDIISKKSFRSMVAIGHTITIHDFLYKTRTRYPILMGLNVALCLWRIATMLPSSSHWSIPSRWSVPQSPVASRSQRQSIQKSQLTCLF